MISGPGRKNLIKQILTRMIFQTSVVGNHDDDNATNNFFDADYVYGYLLAAEEPPTWFGEKKISIRVLHRRTHPLRL